MTLEHEQKMIIETIKMNYERLKYISHKIGHSVSDSTLTNIELCKCNNYFELNITRTIKIPKENLKIDLKKELELSNKFLNALKLITNQENIPQNNNNIYSNSFTQLHKKIKKKISLPTFRKIILNEETLKPYIKIIDNTKRKSYLILNEEKILQFFKTKEV